MNIRALALCKRQYLRMEMCVNSSLQKFINDQELVLVGYTDAIKGVNLIRLLEYWVDSDRGGSFDVFYPFAAEYFEVYALKSTPLEANIYKKVIDHFAKLPHSKAWFRGEEMMISIAERETWRCE